MIDFHHVIEAIIHNWWNGKEKKKIYGFKFEFNLTTLSRSSFITYHPPKKKLFITLDMNLKQWNRIWLLKLLNSRYCTVKKHQIDQVYAYEQWGKSQGGHSWDFENIVVWFTVFMVCTYIIYACKKLSNCERDGRRKRTMGLILLEIFFHWLAGEERERDTHTVTDRHNI